MKQLIYSIPLFFALTIIQSCSSNMPGKNGQGINNDPEMPSGIDLEERLDATEDPEQKKIIARELIDFYLKESENKNYSLNKRAAYVFRCAELYERQLSNYDEAFGLYVSIEKDFPESSLAPRALFMQGLLMTQHFQQLEKANELLSKYISTYPEHEFANMAKDILRLNFEELGIDRDSLEARF